MTRFRLAQLRDEDGIALVVAMLLMAIMLTMALAAIQFSDNQSSLTAQQRQRESAFNVAEAALNAEVTQLSRHWADQIVEAPSSSQCPGATYCPTASELTAMIPSGDTAATAITWKTNVYDNSGKLAGYFADSLLDGTQVAYDANGDNKMWVRAQATVRGKTRVVVSLVQQQKQAESVPHAAIVTGRLTIENNGLHGSPIIDANGGIVAVRCSVAVNEASPCLGQPLGTAPTKTPDQWSGLLTNQIDGFATAQTGYSTAPVFSQDQIYRFIATAKAESTYYTSCPSNLAGSVVVVNTTGNCSYTGSTVWNTTADPGFLMFLNAGSSLTLGGTTRYNGVVYHANMGVPPTLGSSPQSSGVLVTTQGNTLIYGGVIIEGADAIMDAGESGTNIEFDDHAFGNIASLAAVGIIQNSWREIQPGV
jgi:type II secretory pathway pseudopilin PulG